MTKYLDIKSLKVLDTIIELDDDIVDTIIELNKKSYITKNSCSGHKNVQFYPFELSLDKKNEAVQNNYLIYHESDKLYCVLPSCSTYVYVSFNDNYYFKKIPQGFKYDEKSNDLSYRVDFFDNSGNKKDDSLIEKELKDVNNSLYNWALSLKPYQK